MNEENWINYKKQLELDLKKIEIPMDISPGIARNILANIDRVFVTARIEYAKLDGQKEKVDSIIREWERTKIEGSNELDRKKNASMALQNYKDNRGNSINMYDLRRNIYSKYIYMASIIDVLNAKQSRLITLSGIMKLENALFSPEN